MPHPKLYPWQRLVQDAVDENEFNKLAVKVRMAETEIFKRIHKFNRKDDGKEEQALFDALEMIRTRRSIRYGARLGRVRR